MEAQEAANFWGIDLVSKGGLLDIIYARLSIPRERWAGLKLLPRSGGSSRKIELHKLVRSHVATIDPVLASQLPAIRIATPVQPPSDSGSSQGKDVETLGSSLDKGHLCLEKKTATTEPDISRDLWDDLLSSSDDEDFHQDLEREQALVEKLPVKSVREYMMPPSMASQQEHVEENLSEKDTICFPKPKKSGAHTVSTPALAAISELLQACMGASTSLEALGMTSAAGVARRWYDARSRTALRLVAVWLQVPWQKIVNMEMLLSGESCPIGGGRPHIEHIDSIDAYERKMRYLKVGAAAAVGGTLLGLTGGLAAPAIAAGLGSVLGVLPMAGAATAAGTVSGFVASTAGVATLATAGTAAGAGVAGGGMVRRTADVSEFGFTEVAESQQIRLEEEDSAAEEQMKLKSHELLYTVPPPRRRSAASGSLAIGVSGWIGGRDDFTKPWSCLLAPGVDAYGLVWESKEMLALGNALGTLVTRQATSTTANLAIQHFFYAGAGLIAALGPSVLLGVGLSLAIENSWAVAMERSVKAGKLLAQLLAAGGAGDRPVVLVGHSMGARLIFHCLLELCRLGARGIVQDVVLLGTPVGIQPERWRMARRIVSSRLINGYSRSDWVIGTLAGGSTGWVKPNAGICPVPLEAPGIENINLGSLAKGHGDYLEHLHDIIDILGVFS